MRSLSRFFGFLPAPLLLMLLVLLPGLGPGISEQDLPHIFERFYRSDSAKSRSSEHSGLGLAIAKHIVEAHGGSIAVVSKVGVGTTFSIDLPVSAGS